MIDSNYTGDNLLVIIGSPRSGTSYLQRLLSCHPKIRTGQESDIFDEYIGPLLRSWKRHLRLKDNRGGTGLGGYLREEQFLEILKQFLFRLLEPVVGPLKDEEIFVEKTPSHALFIPEIIGLLAGVRFIHVVRDPRDVVASMLAASNSWGKHWAPKNAREAALMWGQHVKAVLSAKPSIPPDQFFEIKYESLVAQPLQVLQNLKTFLHFYRVGGGIYSRSCGPERTFKGAPGFGFSNP